MKKVYRLRNHVIKIISRYKIKSVKFMKLKHIRRKNDYDGKINEKEIYE